MRQLILLGIVVAALVAILWARPAGTPSADMPALNYVTTAHQLGVVGYRDPPGAISPDGKRFAYAEGRFIRVIPIGGGAPVTLPAGEGQIRYLTWSATDTIVAEDPTATARWWKYPMSGAARQPLWSGNDKIPVSDLRQLTWRSGGQSAAAISVGKDGAQLWTIRADGGLDATTAIKGRVSSPAWTDPIELIGPHVAVVHGRSPRGAHFYGAHFYAVHERGFDSLIADFEARLLPGGHRISPDGVLIEWRFDQSHLRGEIGELVLGRTEGRTGGDDVTIFKSLGMAVEDVVAADLVFRRAAESGAGTELVL